MRGTTGAFGLLGLLTLGSEAIELKPRDLNAVTFKSTPSDPPVSLVEKGRAKVTIAVMGGAAGGGPLELQRSIQESTGCAISIVNGKIEPPAMVIGDCDLAKQHGLDGRIMPSEGFAIKTAKDLVFIVGNGRGMEWGCYEFLERFVGVRWYWPTDLGRSVPRTPTLMVPPVWIEDAPFFRKREIWPPCSNSHNGTGTPLGPLQTFLRSGNSWSINYQKNRDQTVGTFINGETDHWPRQNITLYCWMKLLWNPDFDVDAAMDEFCQRMFGPAAKSIRELLQLQMDGWEKSRWPDGRLSAKAIHEISYPRKTVLRMEELLQRAREDAKGDGLALKRVEYYAAPFAAFFTDSKNYAEGGGLRPLLAQKVGENPKLDGKLDDPVWQRAQELSFVRAYDREKKAPKYSTTVKAVWTADGITFGFRMTEPTPELLEARLKGHDDSMLWWDDNIELLFDVTGKNEGNFHHFIVTPLGTIMDSKGKDASWNTDQVKVATQVGKDFWSLEVFVPFEAFPEAAKPGSGTRTVWYGNFTRHRVADNGLKTTKPHVEGSEREYTRMNTTYAGPSNNLADFATIKFTE